MITLALAERPVDWHNVDMVLTIEIICILMLVAANGLLAMTEMALVSSRRAHLRAMAKSGDKKAQQALALSKSPGEFLSTIQVGITTIGILAGVFSGATLSLELSRVIAASSLVAPYADLLAIVIIVSVITLFTLVFGELVPKRIALRNPERIARATAIPMKSLAWLCWPATRFVNSLSERVLKLIGSGSSDESRVSELDVEELVAEGRRAGVFHRVEQEMISGILRLDEVTVESIMTPATDIVWIDITCSDEQIMEYLQSFNHERFPVSRKNLDDLVGIANARDLLLHSRASGSLDVKACMYQPHIVPETKTALDLLEEFKSSRIHVAVVLDEHGAVKGIVTVSDILDPVLGQLREKGQEMRWEAIQRKDGSWLIDAVMPVSELHRLFGLPEREQSWYHTAGGLVLHQLEHIPEEGEQCEYGGLGIEVVDMDGQRIDKLLVSPQDRSSASTS